MPRDKAPDNMPTEAIECFIETAEGQLAEWSRTYSRTLKAHLAAGEQVEHYAEKVEEYVGWLAKRQEEGERDKQ